MRKLSSAASAGNASIDHMRDWVFGSDEWQSIAVPSEGNSYGVPEGLIFSFPCTTKDGKWKIIDGVKMDDEETVNRMKVTTDELLSERDAVASMLK